jgi:hypothetical protein
MTAWRFFLILVILAGASVGWLLLGTSVYVRTSQLQSHLGAQVDSLWGPANLAQSAPYVEPVQGQGPRTEPLKSNLAVHLDHENRRKGLLWFSTYTVEFNAEYGVSAPPGGQAMRFVFPLPADVPFMDNLTLAVDGQPRDVDTAQTAQGLQTEIPADGQEHVIAVTYRTRGRDQWTYLPAGGAVQTRSDNINMLDRAPPPANPDVRPAHVRNFLLTLTTNFTDINYPEGSMSPSEKAEPMGGGLMAVWEIQDSRTRQAITVVPPARPDAGPIAARMAFWAPVGLFFFFTVLFTIMLLKRVPLHPMHYLLVSAAFFAFHILLAYLVDHVDIQVGFWISAAVSVLLVVSYMRLAAGARFAVLYAGLAQLVYLVGFSYAFFFVGYTGLSIVIVAILTLLVIMMATGRVDWNEVFKKKPPARAGEDGWASVAPAPPSAPPSAR